MLICKLSNFICTCKMKFKLITQNLSNTTQQKMWQFKSIEDVLIMFILSLHLIVFML